MRAVDTNILLRFLLGDDPIQVPMAEQVIGQGAFVSLTVFIEAEWVLRGLFRSQRALIADLLASLFDVPALTIEAAALCGWAVERYRLGADLADMIHIVAGRSYDAFTTFDRKLARQAGTDIPMPVELLG